MTKLLDLDPRWFTPSAYDLPAEGAAVRGVTGLTFECPCPKCRAGAPVRLAIPLARPPDGGPPVPMGPKLMGRRFSEPDRPPLPFDVPADFLWNHTGTTFEDLTLKPSVNASASGHWHGFIRNGEVT